MSVPVQTTNDPFAWQPTKQRYPVVYNDEQHQRQVNSHFTNQTFGATLYGNNLQYGGISLGGYRQGMSMRTNSNTSSASILPRYTADSTTGKPALSMRPSPSHTDLLPPGGSVGNATHLVTRLAPQIKSSYSPHSSSTGTFTRPSSTSALLLKGSSGQKNVSREGIDTSKGDYYRQGLTEHRPVPSNTGYSLTFRGKTESGYLSPTLTSPSQPSKAYLPSYHRVLSSTTRVGEYSSRLIPQKDEADRSQMERLSSTKPPVVLSAEEHKILDKLLEFVSSQKSLDQHTYRVNKERIFAECLPSDQKNLQRLRTTVEKNRSLDEKIRNLTSQVKELQTHFAEVGDYFSPEVRLQEISSALNKKHM